jgi:hypothetical protein
VVLLFISGCNYLSDFGDTNVNPAVTNTPNTAALLTNVLSGFGNYSTVYAPALYCQFFSETQYPDVSCYSTNSATPQGVYSGNLYDLQNIILTNTNAETKEVASLNGANENQIAIARILKAYIFWTITDRWGDVPYFNALNGDPNASYSRQELIYKDLIKELTEANAQFVTGAAIKGDIAYSGNIAKWKKLSNSMRMLMALRLSKQYPSASGYAATEFKAALADAAGSISTNADNFTLVYPGGNFKNQYFNMYDGRRDYGESQTMTRLLVDTLGGDARSAVYGADLNGNPSTLGVPYGRVRGFIDPWCGQNPTWAYVFAPAYRTATSPLYIVKASGILLARAEAAQLGWTTENVNTMYVAGITASHNQWGLADPAAAYLANAKVALPGTNSGNLRFIRLQQYIAYFPDGIQGWANWRRTNVPSLTPAPDATNNPKVIPRRYMYGSTDLSLTPDSVKAAIIRQWGAEDKNLMDQKVWWDK